MLARRHNHGHGMEHDLGGEDNFVNNSSLSSASSSLAEGGEGKEVEEEDEDDGPKDYKRVSCVVDSISPTRSSSSSDTRYLFILTHTSTKYHAHLKCNFV